MKLCGKILTVVFLSRFVGIQCFHKEQVSNSSFHVLSTCLREGDFYCIKYKILIELSKVACSESYTLFENIKLLRTLEVNTHSNGDIKYNLNPKNQLNTCMNSSNTMIRERPFYEVIENNIVMIMDTHKLNINLSPELNLQLFKNNDGVLDMALQVEKREPKAEGNRSKYQ